MPIFAMTPSEKAYHQMAFFWGVIPIKTEVITNVTDAIKTLSSYAIKTKLLHDGDLVVIITGSPFWIKGATNTIIVESIGKAAVPSKKSKSNKSKKKS